jgi:hypothetical protein
MRVVTYISLYIGKKKIKVYNTGRIIDLNQQALHKHMATFLVKKIQEHIPCLLNSPGHKQEH